MYFGLIGKSLKHSFSQNYFTHKFTSLNLPFSYHLYELENLESIHELLNRANLKGLNVTIPYKTDVLRYVNKVSPEVQQIGAANVLCRENNLWVAYNTDTIGFQKSLFRFLPQQKSFQAIVLGNGGASKAVTYVLEEMNIPYVVIARTPQNSQQIPIEQFADYAKDYKLWINTTPIGMYPHFDEVLNIDFSLASASHYLFDLIYNPEETSFMLEGKKYGAKTQNGLEMLHLQADAAWEIWQRWI